MALDLLSYGAIHASMNLYQPTASVASGMKELFSLQYLEQATSVTEEGFGIMFDAPTMWHSVVIVRSCTDWTRILNILTTLRFLGQLRLARVEKGCQQKDLRSKSIPNEAEAKTRI